MRVGFKTGPGNFEVGRSIVEKDNADFCEVWFNVTDLPAYDELFHWMAMKKVDMGLHHWGLVDGKYKTNLMTNNEHIRHITLSQIKQTIDIAKSMGAVYVNAHPGARRIEKINFDTGEQETVPDIDVTPQVQAEHLLLEAGRDLQAYAEQQGVMLTIETLPARESGNYNTREHMYDAGSAGLGALRQLASQGNYIANDITHSAGQAGIDANGNEEKIWETVLSFTNAVRNQTKLLHINTLMPPHDGRDSHDGILEKDFEKGVFPNRAQIIEFLELFRERDDVFVISEPHSDMQSNFQALRSIVSNL